jgi:filamentous hemagglutinin
MPGGGRTISGDLYAQSNVVLNFNFSGTCSYSGNVFAGSTNASHGMRIQGTGICQLNINGSITGGSTQNANGFIIDSSAATINIIGTLNGASNGSSVGTAVNAGCVLNVTGTVNGGSANVGLSIGGAAVVTVNGNAIGAATSAISNGSNGSFLYGTFNAIGSSTSTSPGVFGSTVNPNWAVTNIVNTTASIGIGGAVRVSSTNPTWTFITSAGSTLTLTNPTSSTLPAITDVRSGTVYGGGAYIGTLAMPPTTSVSYGVAVDNTTGSAFLTANNFFAAVSESSDPVAVRLRNVSTVQTTGDQLQAVF